MKFLSSQIAYFLSERDTRQNIRALTKYLIFVTAVIGLYSVLFHIIMLRAEGQYHSWITGIYWTLTTMTTLGFGDITFTSDIGRLFSILVMLSGIVLLLVLLPFMFIRFFFAPWLEAQVRVRAPREAPAETSGHVIICRYDTIAPGLIERLRLHGIPCYVIESDIAAAAQLHSDGVSVIAGDVESAQTYRNLRVAAARLVFANCSDTVNTNIILTIREIAPDVPIVGHVHEEDSIDILELSGCTYVVPLHQRLGTRLANRVNAGHAQSHVIGNLGGLKVADFAVHNTPLVGRTVGDIKLHETTGVNLIAVWKGGRLLPAVPATVLTKDSVAVVVGTAEQMMELDLLLVIYDTNYNPALIIGGGRVGQATACALKQKDIPVHLLERDESLRARLGDIADRVFIGDAADREVLMKAGLREAPSVILTTNDDAMNIYLAVYCRRLNPELRIISRVTHQKNIEAIYRAGADFAISYASLGIEEVFAQLHSHELLILGEGYELFSVLVPPALVGKTLAESRMIERTELSLIALQENGHIVTKPPLSTRLMEGSELLMMGGTTGRQAFQKAFGTRKNS